MSNNDDRGPQVAGVAGGFLAASWICVLLRAYTRIFVMRAFGADDYLIVISQLFYTGLCTSALLGVHYGTGKHAIDILPADLIQGLKWWWVCEPLFTLGNMVLKLSIGIFLLRIAMLRWQRIVIWVTMIGSSVLNTWFFFMFLFQCYPSSYFWERFTGTAKGSCLDTKIIVRSNYAFSSLECLADWTYFILPCVMVWNLKHMNRRTKVSVVLLLGLCGIASIATIIRFPYLSSFNNKQDFLYATTDVAIWAISENGLGQCATSIATLRPLFSRFFRCSANGINKCGINKCDDCGPLGSKSNSNPQRVANVTGLGLINAGIDNGADAELGFGHCTRSSVTTTIRRGSIVPLPIGSNADTKTSGAYDAGAGGSGCDVAGNGQVPKRKFGHEKKASQNSLIGRKSEGFDVWTSTTIVTEGEDADKL